MNLLIEELKAPQMARDRERSIRRDDLLATARSTRCREQGCHPLMERVSLFLASAGARLNAWAAPSHRQVHLQLGRDSTPASVA